VRGVLTGTALVLAAACWAGGGGEKGKEIRPAFRFRDPEVREASGIACSRRRKGCFWVHNDSGGQARLFAVDEKGRTVGKVLLGGTLALDWEDCALEPGRGKGGRPRLWVGDIGNNLGLPLVKKLLRFPEPDPAVLAGKTLVVPRKEVQVFRCRFPEGPKDCECLMVHPLTGVPYLVPAVDRKVVGLFRWPGKPLPGRRVRVLEEAALLAVPLDTPAGMRIRAGDFGPRGRWFVLRSLTHFFVYLFPGEKKAGARRKGAKAGLPLLEPVLVEKTPSQLQGEGLAVEPSGKALWLCGEGRGSRVFRVPLPSIPPRARRK